MFTSLNRRFILFLIVLLFTSTGYAQDGKGTKVKVKGKDHLVTIKTSFGEMYAILYDDTPKHKENFIKLANEGFYDSLLFHRVIKGFMIQGGDPESKNAAPDKRLGSGGPGYTIDAEILPHYYHKKGAFSAARLGDQANPKRNSSGSQFYIVQGKKMTQQRVEQMADQLIKQQQGKMLQEYVFKPEHKEILDLFRKYQQEANAHAVDSLVKVYQAKAEAASAEKLVPMSEEAKNAYVNLGGAPHLDNQYTVFGEVIKGLEVIDKIADQPTNRGDRPQKDIMMQVAVKEMPKKKIMKITGYQYTK